MKETLLFLITFSLYLLPVLGQKPQVIKPDNLEIETRYQDKKRITSLYLSGFSLPVVNKMLSPEQDCIAAIPLCDSTYTQTNSYVGQGNIPNEINSTTSCLLSGEKNDVWYTFTVQSSGNLNFSITPINGNDDYDWALFNLTNHVCSDIFNIPSLEVSCNYAPNLGCGGITGPNNDTTGTCGGQNEAEIPVLIGETYVINVSNFSSTQFGYTINFAQSTATIYDNTPPQPTVSGMNCTDTAIVISYPSELIDCSTIAADGSDFTGVDLNGNIFSITSATGIGCSVNQPYVSQILITFNPGTVYFPGFYLLAKPGSDGNTFADKCGNFAGSNGSTDTVAYINVLNDILVNLGSDTALCASDTKPLLNAQNAGAGFTWTLNGNITGGNTPVLQTTLPGTYIVTVSYGPGCEARDTMVLNYLQGFAFSLGSDTTICQGSPLPVLYTGITNAVQYQWLLNNNVISGALSDSLLPAQAGTYIAIVDSGNAICPGLDTISINEALPVTFDLGNVVTFCEGDSVLIKSGVTDSATYQWLYNSQVLNQDGDSLYATNSGLYVLNVWSVFECKSSDSLVVMTEIIAGPVKVNCPQIQGINHLFTWDPVPGATGYEISTDSVLSWTIPSSGTLGLSHQTTSSIKTIYVHALSGSFCPPGPASESAPCEIVIPNILTPNKDNKNDFFFIKNIEQFPGTRIKIFNRWGTKIFESSDYTNNWDGNKAPDGVYFYEVSAPGLEVKKGNVTIIR